MGPEDAIWDDGEWVSWTDINAQLQHKEWGAKYPNADRSLIPIFEQLLDVAEAYNQVTGSHLQVYGDIGELFAAITLGVKLHRNYVSGSDGRLGDDFIEVKTITPFKANDIVTVKATGNFNKLVVVKINEDFELSYRLVARRELPKPKGGTYQISWSQMPT